MTEYRMYTLDRLGRIGLAEAVIATGDEEALYKVRKLARNAKRCELWKGNRLVASLDDRELMRTSRLGQKLML